VLDTVKAPSCAIPRPSAAFEMIRELAAGDATNVCPVCGADVIEGVDTLRPADA
jgi:hypothetical protein